MTGNPAAQASAPPESQISNGMLGKMNVSPSESVATRDTPRTSSSKPDNPSGGHASAKKRRKVNHGKFRAVDVAPACMRLLSCTACISIAVVYFPCPVFLISVFYFYLFIYSSSFLSFFYLFTPCSPILHDSLIQ